MDMLPSLDELLSKLLTLEGSDLHLKVGSPPAYRVNGSIHLAELRVLKPDDTQSFADQVMNERARREFEESGEADFAYGRQSLGRFRVNCFRQRGSISVVLRAVDQTTPNFDELGLPKAVSNLCDNHHGLLVVTGRAGTGKTTTLSAMIDYLNTNQRMNIITLEDPIEVLHPDKNSIVSQREVGVDTATFAHGIRKALRQDPDVIYVSEARDRETAEAVLMAAESGHLVLTSMLTADATETVKRIVEYFPPFQQSQIRSILATVLRGVVSQRLLPRKDGAGRVPATEILVNVDRVTDRLRGEGEGPTLLQMMVEGEFFGMQTFDQSLLKLYERGYISFSDAMAHATDAQDLKLAAQALGLTG
jgi:twitching motility protein PilT